MSTAKHEERDTADAWSEDTYKREERDEPTVPGRSDPCQPYGAAITQTKPYWYIVQPEDIGSFWRIPEKFNLPAQGPNGSWRWHELRNANLDWPGGFVTVNQACVLSGLTPGVRLHVPASWPEPKPGVQTVAKDRGKPSKGKATAALVVGAIGLVGIGALAYIAWKDKKR